MTYRWPRMIRICRLATSDITACVFRFGDKYSSASHHPTLAFMSELNNLQRSPTGGPIATQSDGDRTRMAKACSACSRQKLRCDGAQPCARCRTAGSEQRCIYLPSMRGKIKRRRVNSSKSVIGDEQVSGSATTIVPELEIEAFRRPGDSARGPSVPVFRTANSALWDTGE